MSIRTAQGFGGVMRDALRKLPYRWRHWLRGSEAGYWLRADRWMP